MGLPLYAALALFLTSSAFSAQEPEVHHPLGRSGNQSRGTFGGHVEVTGLPENAPFRVSASIDRARLVIDLSFDRGWHAYARDVGGGDPVRIRMADAEDGSTLGELKLPETADGELDGNRRLIQHLNLADGETAVDAILSLTVCDALECLPPMELRVVGEVQPLGVLIVVDQVDDRAKRIQAFLTEEGFQPEVVTYGAVTKEVCDAYDVVVADSKLFGEGKRVAILDFPKTDSPVVAVGFLGTELVEAHGLAMTSGYI